MDVGNLPNHVKYCLSVLKPPLSNYQYTPGPRMGRRNPQHNVYQATFAEFSVARRLQKASPVFSFLEQEQRVKDLT